MFLYLYYKYIISVLYWYSMAISGFYQNLNVCLDSSYLWDTSLTCWKSEKKKRGHEEGREKVRMEKRLCSEATNFWILREKWSVKGKGDTL